MRFFEPCGDPSLAWNGYGNGVHARLYEDPDLHEGDAGHRDCQGGKPYFPAIDEEVLAECIGTYQQLGCRTPYVEITPAAYARTLDVFKYVGPLKHRYRYEQVCAAPPATD